MGKQSQVMEMPDKEQMLKNIKLRLGIAETDTENDSILMLMLNDAIQTINVFCNRKIFPWQLEHVARQLVVNVYNRDNSDNVASIKRGDTQITYSGNMSENDLTIEHRELCARYRRLRSM